MNHNPFKVRCLALEQFCEIMSSNRFNAHLVFNPKFIFIHQSTNFVPLLPIKNFSHGRHFSYLSTESFLLHQQIGKSIFKLIKFLHYLLVLTISISIQFFLVVVYIVLKMRFQFAARRVQIMGAIAKLINQIAYSTLSQLLTTTIKVI